MQVQVYGTKGNEYGRDGRKNRSLDRVYDYFRDNIRLAVKSNRGRLELFLQFLAKKEEQGSRFNRFYARFQLDETGIKPTSLINELEQELDDWGYIIKQDDEFYQAVQQKYTSPGDSADKEKIKYLISEGKTPIVGVSRYDQALGLLRDMIQNQTDVAIGENFSPAQQSEEWDLRIVPGGRHRGIQPIGETQSDWEEAEEKVRELQVDAEINDIKQSVQTLSREHGLSKREIRKRVTSEVPALRSSSTARTQTDAESTGSDDSLARNAISVGLIFIAIGMITLGVFLMGGVPDVLPGGEQEFTIEGNVIEGNVTHADPNGTIDNLTDENITVAYHDPEQNESITAADDEGITVSTAGGEPDRPHNYTIETNRSGEYNITVDVSGFAPATSTHTLNDTNTPKIVDFELEPNTLQGTVSAADTGNLEPGNITLETRAGDEEVANTTTDGAANFELTEVPVGNYTLIVDPDDQSYETQEKEIEIVPGENDTVEVEVELDSTG